MTRINYQCTDFGDGDQVVAATSTGVVFIGGPNAGRAELVRFFPQADVVEAETPELQAAIGQLQEYREGNRQTFNLATDTISGTPFQRTVWRALSDIAYGQTVSYGELADRIGRPTAVRAVASAVAKNPLMEIVPCHRVTLSTGKTGQFRGGAKMKAALIKLEQQ